MEWNIIELNKRYYYTIRSELENSCRFVGNFPLTENFTELFLFLLYWLNSHVTHVMRWSIG